MSTIISLTPSKSILPSDLRYCKQSSGDFVMKSKTSASAGLNASLSVSVVTAVTALVGALVNTVTTVTAVTEFEGKYPSFSMCSAVAVHYSFVKQETALILIDILCNDVGADRLIAKFFK